MSSSSMYRTSTSSCRLKPG